MQHHLEPEQQHNPVEKALLEEVHRRELVRFLECLQSQECSVLIMKGTALAYSKYGEPSDRPRLDTDVWIRPSQVQSVKTTLQKGGFHYYPTNHGTLVHTQMVFYSIDRSGQKHYFDVHWHPFNPVLLRDVLTFEEAWATSEKLNLSGFVSRRPADFHQVLLSCAHWAGHHFLSPSPIWIQDLVVLTEDKDELWWKSLVQLFKAKGLSAMGGQIFAYCRTQGLSKIPEFVIPSLLKDCAGEKSRYFLRPDRNRLRDLLFDLKCLPTWRLKIQLLKEHLFPDSEYLRGASPILRILKGLKKLTSISRP